MVKYMVIIYVMLCDIVLHKVLNFNLTFMNVYKFCIHLYNDFNSYQTTQKKAYYKVYMYIQSPLIISRLRIHGVVICEIVCVNLYKRIHLLLDGWMEEKNKLN